MATDPQPPADPRDPYTIFRPGAAVIGLVVVNVIVELILEGADHGLWGTPLWRGVAYHDGAFWAGLLDNWRPNFPLQPATMFVSYAFLHGGLSHLLGNMLVLLIFGPLISNRFGQAGMLAIYGGSIIAGGIGFALLGSSYQPMVGASGALFGLAGAWAVSEFAARHAAGRRTWPIWRDIVGLALLNLVLWYALDGLLAWEAHLGGFVGGAAVAVSLGGRARRA